MKQVKVSVEDKHIKAGIRNNGAFCPVALAVKEKLDLDSVHVSKSFVYFLGKEYKLSRRACEFVNKIDDARDVSPFTFILNIEK